MVLKWLPIPDLNGGQRNFELIPTPQPCSIEAEAPSFLTMLTQGVPGCEGCRLSGGLGWGKWLLGSDSNRRCLRTD